MTAKFVVTVNPSTFKFHLYLKPNSFFEICVKTVPNHHTVPKCHHCSMCDLESNSESNVSVSSVEYI